MKIIENTKNVTWINIGLFYILACGLTYLFVQLPNLIEKIWEPIFGFNANFSWNHGIALLVASIIAYRIFKVKRETTLLGKNPIFSLIFGSIFLIGYSAIGFNNDFGINTHLWAFIFCLATLIYDIFEESAWRGFLNDSLKSIPFWLKGIITGILWGFWHLLIFNGFDQFGGIHIFVLLSIVVSIIMAYATDKTNSILVASSIHALMILRDINITIICVVIWIIMIIVWNKCLLNKKRIKTKYGA